MAGTGVIINEFGEVGIDDALVEKIDDDAVLLPSGCVCCEVRGDLVEALERMHTALAVGRHSADARASCSRPPASPIRRRSSTR